MKTIRASVFQVALLLATEFHLGLCQTLLNLSIDLDVFSSGTAGIQIIGGGTGDNAGQSVSGAGDMNGDEIQDYVVGVASASPLSRFQAGISYVVFGVSSSIGVTLDLITFSSGIKGFKILGASAGDGNGKSVSKAGDINGDGIGDLIVSSKGANRAGIVYVIFGKTSLFADIICIRNVWL